MNALYTPRRFVTCICGATFLTTKNAQRYCCPEHAASALNKKARERERWRQLHPRKQRTSYLERNAERWDRVMANGGWERLQKMMRGERVG